MSAEWLYENGIGEARAALIDLVARTADPALIAEIGNFAMYSDARCDAALVQAAQGCRGPRTQRAAGLSEHLVQRLPGWLDPLSGGASRSGLSLLLGDLHHEHLVLRAEGGRWVLKGLLDLGDALTTAATVVMREDQKISEYAPAPTTGIHIDESLPPISDPLAFGGLYDATLFDTSLFQ